MNDAVLIAIIALVPSLIGGYGAYRAARYSASRDRAQDGAQVLEAARERAHDADQDRAAMRESVLLLERRFDRLRSVLRRVVDALEGVEPDHDALQEAREALEELGPN